MTNNLTIDGVSRDLPHEDATHLKAVIKKVIARNRMSVHAQTDAAFADEIYREISEHLPVYEDVYDQLGEIIEPHVRRPYRPDAPLPASVVDSVGFLLREYLASQSTIAQLEDKLNKAIDLDFQRRERITQLEAEATYAAAAHQAARDRIAELESGRGELIYQVRTHGSDCWEDISGESLELCQYQPEEYEIRKLFTAPPAPVAVVHPFAEKVTSKLRRFEECASDFDADGVDIGRHWLDLLTQLGLLNRVQRSPALWEITQQGEDCLAATAALNEAKA